MDFARSVFTVFVAFALVSAVMVIRAKNPVYAVLFLILVFCNASGLLMLIDLDFFAVVFLVVYVGAIAVLFLFVVMMLNIKLSEINENILRYVPFGGVFGLLFLCDVLFIMEHDIVPVIVLDTAHSVSMVEKGLSSTLHYGIALLALLWETRSSSLLPLSSFALSLYVVLCVTSRLPRRFVPELADVIKRHLPETYITITTLEMLQYSFFSRTSAGPLLDEWVSTIKGNVTPFTKGAEDVVSEVHNMVPMGDVSEYIGWPHTIEQDITIEALGQVVYTYYMYFFILASAVLLIAMIGAIVLTMHKGVAVKRQDVFVQNTRDFTKTLVKLKKTDRVSIDKTL
jgi:NADH:ubiquinone oxidoreductase subunit 6 (subunit J)